jgi:Tfp pilus assembly protein PilF
MKKFSLVILSVMLLAAAGCSRSDKPETSVKPSSTPDAERLKADSERLQQATANAARAREKEAQLSPTPSPTPAQP